MQFYPYERIPKVWRNSYTIDRTVFNYRRRAKYVNAFEICREDVTDKYNVVSDIEIETDKELTRQLADKKYVYVAMAINASGPQWRLLDFGTLKRGKACFSKMGRNMLYIALGYNGNKLIPISHPFILHKDGQIEYVNGSDNPV